jgi:hypothetical protein
MGYYLDITLKFLEKIMDFKQRIYIVIAVAITIFISLIEARSVAADNNVEFTLKKIKYDTGFFPCDIIIQAKNNTRLNFTKASITFELQDSDGDMMGNRYVTMPRLKPYGKNNFSISWEQQECKEIKSVILSQWDYIEVDGNISLGPNLNFLTMGFTYKSNVKGISFTAY